MTPEQATALRKPFPPESIGKLPKAGMMLDYAGHAAVTDRLLMVDPEWTWRPFTAEEILALPPTLRDAGLWIHLTVAGVERPGVGDGSSAKECIGDAIRNAAMRFGVALDLWAKENLVEFAQAVNRPLEAVPPHPQEPADEPDEPLPAATVKPMTGKTRGQMFALFGEQGIEDDQQLPGINQILGTAHTSRSQLTEDEAKQVISALRSRSKAKEPANA